MWLVMQHLSCASNIGKTVTNIADAVFSGNLWFKMSLAHYCRHSLGEFRNRVLIATGNVEDAADRLWRFERQAARLSNVVDVDKITLLVSIFEDQWGAVIQQARSEDRQDTCVRIGECLPRS